MKSPSCKYLINQSHLDSRLYIANGIIQFRSFEDRSFPIAVVNVTDTEIVIKEDAQKTTTESCEGITCTTTLVDYLSNKINKEVCRFLKQKKNMVDSDNNRNTGNKEEIIETSKSNFRFRC